MSNVIDINNASNSRQIAEVRALLVTHLPAIRRFAYSLTKDMDDADDLVQRVAEKLLKNSIPEDRDPLPWIFRVCKNAWIDELRARKVRDTNNDVEPDALANEHKAGTADEVIKQRDIQQAIDKLPDKYADVIKHVIVGGLSYAETAEALDVPIGTVMSRVARARQKLSQLLANGSG